MSVTGGESSESPLSAKRRFNSHSSTASDGVPLSEQPELGGAPTPQGLSYFAGGPVQFPYGVQPGFSPVYFARPNSYMPPNTQTYYGRWGSLSASPLQLPSITDSPHQGLQRNASTFSSHTANCT